MGKLVTHDKCERCRNKGLGKAPYLVGAAICTICDAFTDTQREILSSRMCQIEHKKKSRPLISPKEVCCSRGR